MWAQLLNESMPRLSGRSYAMLALSSNLRLAWSYSHCLDWPGDLECKLRCASRSLSPQADNTEVWAVTHTSWQKAANDEERLGEQETL